MPTIRHRARQPDVEALLTRAGQPRLLSQLLASRGVSDPVVADLSLRRLWSDEGMRGIPEAAKRIADAVLRQERILIAGDFDCDGATATSVAVSGLALLGAKNVDFMVPNRLVHGYGLTPHLVEDIILRSPDLVITVDNGIAAATGVSAAQDAGIDVVVTDHHLPGDILPNCVIVDPNQRGCSHPGKNLAGVGVMFYTLGAVKRELLSRGALPAPGPNLRPLLDLVALGTVADVVRLDENNRILVKEGLARIRAGKARPGIQALFEVSRRNPAFATAEDFGFSLGPRINAAGRLDDMTWGIRCLLADDMETARHYAQELDRMNQSRKGIETDMKQQAELILASANPAEQGVTVVMFDPTWHQGVVGLLASRVKDATHRPVIVLTQGNPGVVKGSGRSIPGLHLRDALDLVDKRHPGVLIKFGGHAMAAGLSIHGHKLDEFKLAFELVVRELMPPEALTETLELDGELDPEYLTVEELTPVRDAVWGQGFPAPQFMGEFRLLKQSVLMNKVTGEPAHSKLELGYGGLMLEGILFNHAEPLPNVFEATYRPELNTFRGVHIQLTLDRLI